HVGVLGGGSAGLVVLHLDAGPLAPGPGLAVAGEDGGRRLAGTGDAEDDALVGKGRPGGDRGGAPAAGQQGGGRQAPGPSDHPVAFWLHAPRLCDTMSLSPGSFVAHFIARPRGNRPTRPVGESGYSRAPADGLLAPRAAPVPHCRWGRRGEVDRSSTSGP